MIQVEMIEDVRKTETKAIGPFTLRQVICIIISLVYSVPIALLIPVDWVVKLLIGFVLALPVTLCGWVKLNKEPFEIVAMRYVYKYIFTPRKRKYKVINPYKAALKKVRSQKEVEYIASLSAKERKQYEKTQKEKTITYSEGEEYKVYK